MKKHPHPLFVFFVFTMTLLLVNMMIIGLGLRDSLLFMFTGPCVLCAFFYGRRLYLSMAATLTVFSIWTTFHVSQDFNASLTSITITNLSIIIVMEIIRHLVTSRKQTEEKLAFERAQLLSIFDSIDEIIYITDPETNKLLYVNDVVKRVFNRELVGGICYRELQNKDAPCEFCTNEIILNQKPAPHRWEFYNPIVEKHYSIIDRIIKWPDGRDVRFELAIDITERKLAETKLNESHHDLEQTLAKLNETQQRMMHQERLVAVGQLSAGIAHDFNNILAAIILQTELSLNSTKLSPTIRQRLEVVAERGAHAAELVQQILDFSQQSLIKRHPLAMNPLLKETGKLLERTLPENIEISLTLESGECTIHGDQTRVQQAIVNLALNAQDSMPNGGELHISLFCAKGKEINCVDCGRIVAGEWIQVNVSDTGRGIAPEVLPHIFEPFFTTRAPLGHGLGLAQVYGIMKKHEGHLEVETRPGHGTTFSLYWPAISLSPAGHMPEIKPEAAQGAGRTILIVEDNKETRTALVDVMDMLGYQVLEADNGYKALEVCDQYKDDTPGSEPEISLVLSDWVMPSMGGVELARTLQTQHPAISVLLLTGHSLNEKDKLEIPANVTGWMQKPLKLKELAQAVNQAISEKSKSTAST